MKHCLITILAIVGMASGAAWAQIAQLNSAGVAAGHEHLTTANQEAFNRFWTAVGGVTQPMAPGGSTQIVKFTGIVLMAAGARGGGGRGAGTAPAATPAPATPPAGSVGSTVEHLSFKVKSLKDTLAKLAAIGIQPMPGATGKQAFVMSPDNMKVGLIDDTSIATAAADEMLMKVPNAAEAAAWYAKWFGAKLIQQGQDTVAQIPGVSIRFAETKDTVVGTQGRALDHIGFEVKNLEALMTKMTAEGVKVTRAYSAPTNMPAPLKSLGFIEDPWGTRIELNEGFADIK